MLGQFATTGTLGYITVKHLGVMWLLANGHVFSNAETFLAYASESSALLLLQPSFTIPICLQHCVTLQKGFPMSRHDSCWAHACAAIVSWLGCIAVLWTFLLTC